MKLVLTFAVAALLVVGCSDDAGMTAPGAEAAVANADDEWLAALARNDTDAVSARLAAEFQWIDANGRSRTAAETVEAIDVLAGTLLGESRRQRYHYGHVGVVTSELPDERLMRVWTLEPEGWRAFAVIGTALTTGTTPFAATDAATAGDCDNPCRSLPYTPASKNQKTIADLFMLLKMDEWHPNPERWARYVLDGVYYTTATAQLSKQARVEHLTALAQTGEPSVPGDPVMSMRIVDFDDSAVMVARHDPYRGGQPYLSVRVWALRDGRWQLANTQQTAVADAPPADPVP